MIIKINNTLRINVDKSSCNIQEMRVIKDVQSWAPIAYYTSLPAALNRAYGMVVGSSKKEIEFDCVKESIEKSIQKFIDRLEVINDENC